VIVYNNSEYIQLQDLSIELDNRAFNYGDGFFETVKIINSNAFNFSVHYLRIIESCSILSLDFNYTEKELSKVIETLLIKNNIINGTVKLHFSRDSKGKYMPFSSEVNLLIITNKGEGFNVEKPVELCFYTNEIKTKSKLSTIKSCNALVSVLSSIYARGNNFDNAILFNTDDNVIECFNSNIFIVKEDIIYTPPVSDGCVSGTMRGWVLNNEIVIKKSLSEKEILNADEIFITNAVSGIIPIKKVEETEFFSFELSAQLQKVLISQS
jgi:branched-chain amino acid aminotransferase